MFGRPNVYSMINGFRVRVKDAREQDRNHLVEVDFEVVLTHGMADEIKPAMARDLFEEVNGEWRPKAEILEAVFDITPDTQILEVREHPDFDPVVKIAGALLRKISTYRGTGGAVLLGFTATWTLAEDREASVFIRRLKQGIYLTCLQQQPELLDTSVPAAQQGADVKVDKGGNVESIDGKKGRGRRKPPATEAAAAGEQAAAETVN